MEMFRLNEHKLSPLLELTEIKERLHESKQNKTKQKNKKQKQKQKQNKQKKNPLAKDFFANFLKNKC